LRYFSAIAGEVSGVDEVLKLFTTGAQRLAQEAIRRKERANHPYLGVNHWLAVLVDRHAEMLISIQPGIDITALRLNVLNSLDSGDPGQTLEVSELAEKAQEIAHSRKKEQPAEREIAVVAMDRAGIFNADQFQALSKENFKLPSGGKVETGSIPALQKYGIDLTNMAREGKLSPISGRDEEMQLMLETLCRRIKRNPVLVGPAGVGKTAIVEGFAQRLVDGKIQGLPADTRIITLQISTLLAGTTMMGALEERLQAVITEACRPDIILFIDELHTIIGSGGYAGISDISSRIKPALARGELACIAATTDEEYRLFIENDSALERRFQPIRINELNPIETYEVLNLVRQELTRRTGLEAQDEVLNWIINFSSQFMRNRNFPDKAVDLLEQTYAHARANGKVSVELGDTQQVAYRMVGMPSDLDKKFLELEKRLTFTGVCHQEEIHQLVNHLQVSLRSLDIRTARPNAVILLIGDGAQNSKIIAENIAEAIYGGPERIITIGMDRMTSEHDVSLLVGSPPGYVGHNERLPLHQLAQTPWCVVRFNNIDNCHPSIQELLACGFADGRITDGRGKPIYFSDAIILLSANIQTSEQPGLGFIRAEIERDDKEIYKYIRRALGDSLTEQVDLVIAGTYPLPDEVHFLTVTKLLDELAHRYRDNGLEIRWHESLVKWVHQHWNDQANERQRDQWINQSLNQHLIPYIKQAPAEIDVEILNDKLSIKIVSGQTTTEREHNSGIRK
jgi:ATP-dependent Clp protease ATP-binding subunit ClpC